MAKALAEQFASHRSPEPVVRGTPRAARRPRDHRTTLPTAHQPACGAPRFAVARASRTSTSGNRESLDKDLVLSLADGRWLTPRALQRPPHRSGRILENRWIVRRLAVTVRLYAAMVFDDVRYLAVVNSRARRQAVHRGARRSAGLSRSLALLGACIGWSTTRPGPSSVPSEGVTRPPDLSKTDMGVAHARGDRHSPASRWSSGMP